MPIDCDEGNSDEKDGSDRGSDKGRDRRLIETLSECEDVMERAGEEAELEPEESEGSSLIIPLFQPVNLQMSLSPSVFFAESAFSPNARTPLAKERIFASISVVPCHSPLHQQAIDGETPMLTLTEAALDTICPAEEAEQEENENSTENTVISTGSLANDQKCSKESGGDSCVEKDAEQVFYQPDATDLFSPSVLYESFREAQRPTEIVWNGQLHNSWVTPSKGATDGSNCCSGDDSQQIKLDKKRKELVLDKNVVNSKDSGASLGVMQHSVQFVFLVPGEYDLRCKGIVGCLTAKDIPASFGGPNEEFVATHSKNARVLSDVEEVLHIRVVGEDDESILFEG